MHQRHDVVSSVHSGEKLPATSPPEGLAAYRYRDAYVGLQEAEATGATAALKFLQFVWGAHARWWKITLPVGVLLAAVAGAGVWYLLVPEYSSTATLMIQENAPYIAFPQGNTGSFVRTQLELFRTRAVMALALKQIQEAKPEVREKEKPFEWLNEKLRLVVISGSELVKAAFTDKDPETARIALDAIVQSYLTYHRISDREMTQRVIRALQDEKTKREDTLDKLEAQIRERSKKLGDQGNEPLAGVIRVSALPDVQQRLIEAEINIEMAKAERQGVIFRLDQESTEISEFELDQVVESHPDVILLRAEIGRLTSQIETAEEKLVNPAASQTYQSLKRDLEDRREELEELKRQVHVDLRTEAEDRMESDLQLQLHECDKKIADNEQIRDYLIGKVEQERMTRGDTNENSVELEFLQTDLDREKNVYDKIADRIVSLQTEQVAPARVSLVDAPTEAVQTSDGPWKKLLMVCGAAFVFPLGLVIVWERLLRRINDAASIREQNFPVLAEIAALPKYLPLGQATDGRRRLTLFEESVDSLCASLRLSRDLRDKQVIAVVSAISGEGKTHVSSQLAISLARTCQEPVLLLEADFRAPDIGRLMGISRDAGLLNVLDGEASLDETVVVDVVRNLDVLLAGNHGPKRGFLREQNVEALFEKLRTRYRYIIVDTPPILSASESMVFSAHADATLICARRGHSRVSQIQDAYDRLAKIQSQPIGVILNDVPVHHYLRAYGSYDYSGK